MREKQTYENTITGKLEALPIPDMADAIWSRIEAQLDIDLPTDDGGGNAPAPKSPINFGWLGGAGLICLTAILISIFSLTQSKDREGSSTSTFEEVTPEKTEVSNDERPPPGSPRRNTPNSNTPNAIVNNPVDTTSSADTNTAVNVIFPPLIRDSLQKQIGPSISSTPQKDSTPPSRRSRGVKGITDSDYRIVPKKDSTQ